MRRVVIESPFAGDVPRNIAYAKRAVLDCLKRGEAPYASHLFFTQEGLLDDLVHEERELGIRAGFIWGRSAEIRAVYVDLGWSGGMYRGLSEAKRIGQTIEVRALDRVVTPDDLALVLNWKEPQP